MNDSGLLGLGLLVVVGCSAFDASPADAPAADGGVPGASGTSPCASKHDVCEDFDRGSLTAGWSLSPGDGTATFAAEPAPVSKPASLRMTMAAGYPGPVLSSALPANTHHFRCSFQTLFSEGSDPRYATIFQALSADEGASVSLLVEPSGVLKVTQLAGADVNRTDELSGSLTKNTWVPVSIEVTSGTANPNVRTTVNGIATERKLAIADPSSGYAKFEISVFMNGIDPPSPWAMSFDDVYCDVLP